ncbi:MAG: iron chelate uptake ABC transporter family permease subunit [Clostridium fessum]
MRIAGAFLLLIMLLLLSLIWSVCSGSVSVPIMEFLQELRSLSCAWNGVDDHLGDPSAARAGGADPGGALALSGYLLQTFFHNPIAGPFVLGISSGSKLLVALVMVGFLEWNITINSGMLVAAAFAGALLSMLFVLAIARKMEQMAMLIVGGVMICYICSAITDFVVTFASDADIVNLHNWSRGSFSGMT